MADEFGNLGMEQNKTWAKKSIPDPRLSDFFPETLMLSKSGFHQISYGGEIGHQRLFPLV